MSAANLLRHSRKLRSLRNVVDCERSGLACYFSTGSGSFVVMENELVDQNMIADLADLLLKLFRSPGNSRCYNLGMFSPVAAPSPSPLQLASVVPSDQMEHGEEIHSNTFPWIMQWSRIVLQRLKTIQLKIGEINNRGGLQGLHSQWYLRSENDTNYCGTNSHGCCRVNLEQRRRWR